MQSSQYKFPLPEQNTRSQIIFNCISIPVTHSVPHRFIRVNKERYYMSNTDNIKFNSYLILNVMYQTKISEKGISRKETPDTVNKLTYRSLFPTISHTRIFCMQSHNLASKQLNNKIPSWIPRITMYIRTAPRVVHVFLVSTIEGRLFNQRGSSILSPWCLSLLHKIKKATCFVSNCII